jgi:hypothetical protein
MLTSVVLVDSGATFSCINPRLVSQYNLRVLPLNNNCQLEMADRSSVMRTGRVPLSLQLHFPNTDRHTMSFDAIFEILDCSYDFIFGVDLLRVIYPQCELLRYAAAPASISSTPTNITQVAPTICTMDELLPESAPSVIDSLSLIDQIHDRGVGELPDDELPMRVLTATPAELESEYAPRRAQVMAAVQPLLTENAAITGFCSDPLSAVELSVHPANRHRVYRAQYRVADVLKPAVTATVQRWLEIGRIVHAPHGCPTIIRFSPLLRRTRMEK